MVNSFASAIDEVRRFGEIRDHESMITERELELTNALVGKQIVGIRHRGEDTWELLLENGAIIRFRYHDVSESEWKMT